MGFLRDLFSVFLPAKKQLSIEEINSNFEKKYNDLGVFIYSEDGFTINYENFNKTLRWEEITQLNVYKRDLYTIDQIEMQIVYGEKLLTITEDLPGWYQFVLKTKEVFPTILKDWDIMIINPAFEANFTVIYDKSKAGQ